MKKYKFLDFLGKDIKHGNFSKIPKSVFHRIQALRKKAEKAKKYHE